MERKEKLAERLRIICMGRSVYTVIVSFIFYTVCAIFIGALLGIYIFNDVNITWGDKVVLESKPLIAIGSKS